MRFPHIDMIHAWVAVNDEGDETLIEYEAAPGVWYPMIAGDQAKVDQLRARAQAFANSIGRPVTRVSFSIREEREVLQPEVR